MTTQATTGEGGPGERPGLPPGWRPLAGLLAVALLFAAVVMAVEAFDTADEILCSDLDVLSESGATTCYDGSEAQRVVATALGFASAGLALGAALTAAWLAITGGASRYLMPTVAAALVLGLAAITVNSV